MSGHLEKVFVCLFVFVLFFWGGGVVIIEVLEGLDLEILKVACRFGV